MRSGARIVLELDASGAVAVAYRASLVTPDASFAGRAEVRLADGKVTFGPWGPADPPPWLVEQATAFLRTEWRALQGPDPEPWPARVSRWREAPR